MSTSTRSLSTPLWILACLATAVFLRQLRPVLVPVALAVLISYALDPLVRALCRIHAPRTAGAAIVVAVVTAGIGGVTWTLSDDAADGLRRLPAQLRQARQQFENSTAGTLLERMRAAANGAGHEQPGGSTSASGTQTSDTGSLAATFVWQGSSSLLTIAGQTVTVVFLLFFLLSGADRWRRRLIRVTAEARGDERSAAHVIDSINQQVERFILVRLGTAALVALATWALLAWLGAPSPALWGLLAGIFNSIPYFGPLIVSSGLAIVGFFAGGPRLALEMAGGSLVINTLEGWLVTPPLLGRAARMNTLAVLLSLLFWSWVWGIWGTILAVPLTAAIKTVSDHVPSLQWLSELLGTDPD